MATTTEAPATTLVANGDSANSSKPEPLTVHKDNLTADALDLKDPHSMYSFIELLIQGYGVCSSLQT